MRINCVAADDEPPALAQMEDYISRIPFLELKGTFDNAMKTLEFLKNNKVDLLFLDIEMDGLSGIQLLGILGSRPRVVLTTAYGAYALKAYELDVADYLLKPISFERFLHAVEKVYPELAVDVPEQAGDLPVQVVQGGYFFVRTEYRMQRVDISEITYIEGMREYLVIHLGHERIVALMSFRKIEALLPASNFIRVHKSYIVALDKIRCIERNRICINDQYIPIGEIYRKIFFGVLENRKLVGW